MIADPGVRAFVDVSTLDYFEIGTRCLLRLRIENESLALASFGVHAEVRSTSTEPPTPLAEAGGEALLPGEARTIALWLVPEAAGFEELRGVVRLTDAAGGHTFAGFEGVFFRVGAGANGATRVSLVHVDQRSARVVDNSHSGFGAVPPPGGLVGEARWAPVPLHPLTPAEATDAAPALHALVDRANAKKSLPPPISSAPVRFTRFTIETDEAAYDVDAVLAEGEIATVYAAERRSDRAPAVVKVVADPADGDLLAAEARALRLLSAEDAPQRKHLPRVLGRFRTNDDRAGTVFERIDGIDLSTLRERLRARGLPGVPPRHLLWLMRRCLSVLGWAHKHGVIHGNLDPAHVLVRPRDHNVWLVDWCWSIVDPARTGESFRCLNAEYGPPEALEKKPPLPSADLYSLGKVLIFAAGGDPRTNALPECIDPRMARFLGFLVVESPLGRAQDAWELYARADRLRKELYGEHEFVPFEV
jgi:hypothetical protein